MATYTIRALAALAGNDSAFTNQSAANVTFAQAVDLLDDNSDTTYVESRAGGQAGQTRRTATGTLTLGAPSIASGEYVARVAPFLRIRNGDKTQTYAGAQVYRAADPVPTSAAIVYGGNTSWRTVENSYLPVSWSVSECATLRLYWLDYYGGSTYTKLRTSELGATIYTIARASATSANTTMTTSSYPTINITVSATLDWEASTELWQKLRTVRGEMRIESGGTGAGTGTLMEEQGVNLPFSSTGSITYPIAFTRALPNGTYKIYTRAVRFREDGSSADDTTSAWSSAYTLTMNAPAPNAPTFTLTNDTANDRIAIAVTPVATTGWNTPKIEVQRSIDAGVTWTTIASDVAGTFGSASTIYDYTFKKGITLSYRARVIATNATPITNPSNWAATQTTTFNATMWALKSPTDSTKSILNLNVVGTPQENLLDEVGVFRPLSSRYPTVVSGELGGWDGSLEILLNTSAQWEALRLLVERQEVLVLESLFGWSKYIRIIGGINVTMSGTPTVPIRRVTFSYVETEGV